MIFFFFLKIGNKREFYLFIKDMFFFSCIMSCLSTIQDHFADEFPYPTTYTYNQHPCPNPCNIDVNLHSFSYHGTDPGKGIVKERDMHCELKPYKFKILGNC